MKQALDFNTKRVVLPISITLQQGPMASPINSYCQTALVFEAYQNAILGYILAIKLH